MLTTSDAMRELFALIERVARSDAPVLVRGETGTGKELVAQALHACSPRARRKFAAINCATLTPELLASELFGHVKGAFTGAVRDHKGLFASVQGGTVFLDEVAELPLDLQSRLLRVLQEKKVLPVGSTAPVDVDFRLLSATNKSLREEVRERRFRADLMYRIRVIPLFLPPLAERPGDIEALLWSFLDRFSADRERRIQAIEDDALKTLLRWPWHGNIRELINTLEYAWVMGDGDVLRLADLPPELQGREPPRREERLSASALNPASTDERERVLEVLRRHNGNTESAAAELGWSRTTLWRRRRSLGLL